LRFEREVLERMCELAENIEPKATVRRRRT